MDPTTTLERLRDAITEAEAGGKTDWTLLDDFETFKALDQWLSMGGCLPEYWSER